MNHGLLQYSPCDSTPQRLSHPEAIQPGLQMFSLKIDTSSCMLSNNKQGRVIHLEFQVTGGWVPRRRSSALELCYVDNDYEDTKLNSASNGQQKWHKAPTCFQGRRGNFLIIHWNLGNLQKRQFVCTGISTPPKMTSFLQPNCKPWTGAQKKRKQTEIYLPTEVPVYRSTNVGSLHRRGRWQVRKGRGTS